MKQGALNCKIRVCDIPVLGNLFSTNSNSTKRVELLVFITPKVVESDTELRDLTREMRDRMRGLTDFDDLPTAISGNR